MTSRVRIVGTLSTITLMATLALAQEDNRGAPPAAPGEAGARSTTSPRAYGDGQKLEGKAVTVDHAMRTEIPEPARDNAFSMTVNTYGITATLQTLASATGSAIMERGGNVIDAIIAANAAVGVIEPSMNGVGGDLFMLYWDNKAKKLYGLNASGWAPAGWTLENLT